MKCVSYISLAKGWTWNASWSSTKEKTYQNGNRYSDIIIYSYNKICATNLYSVVIQYNFRYAIDQTLLCNLNFMNLAGVEGGFELDEIKVRWSTVKVCKIYISINII